MLPIVVEKNTVNSTTNQAGPIKGVKLENRNFIDRNRRAFLKSTLEQAIPGSATAVHKVPVADSATCILRPAVHLRWAKQAGNRVFLVYLNKL